jgi:hypothetical protein
MEELHVLEVGVSSGNLLLENKDVRQISLLPISVLGKQAAHIPP